MGNNILTSDQLVTFQAVSGTLAGGGMGSSRMETDRLTEVSLGEHVGQMVLSVAMRPGAGAGYIEYMVFKAERQGSTPTIGTFPIPTDAEVNTQGMQQIYRQNMPGWCIKYGTIPFTPETIHTRDIKISWSKFGKSKVKDGDFFGCAFFNRSAVTVTFDWQVRYYSYKS